MILGFPLRILLLAIALGLSAFSARSENISYPADAGVVNVKTAFGAVGDGVADDTMAIQNAINANAGAQRILYFPNGTYRITAQLAFPSDRFMLTLQGQSEAGTILRLGDATFGFQNTANPRPLIRTADSVKGWTNDAFMVSLLNLTIDTGSNNAGAIGLLYIANNQGSIRNVTIRSSDATKRGIAGIDLTMFSIPGPAFLQDVTIDGFDYGMKLDSAQYAMTAEHLTLTNQKIAGIQNTRHLFAIRGLNFSTPNRNAVAIANAAVGSPQQRGLVVLLDATLANTSNDGSPSAAILNDGDVFLRNITTSGFAAALQERGEILPGSSITEFATGGSISLFPSPPTSLGLPIEDTPTVPWDDPSTWINVQTYGAMPGDGQDDTPAVQAAIDAATATNRTIYFPKSATNQPYQFGGTIIVRGHAQRIVGGFANMMLLPSFASQQQPLFRLVDGTPEQETAKDGLVVFETIWFQWAEATARKTTFFVNERSGSTLIRNCFFSHGKFYDGTSSTGKTFFDDLCISVQPKADTTQPLPGIVIGANEKVWARQLNPETRGGQVRNDGGTLWILGFKTEQYDSDFKTAPHIHTRNGGSTELLGGFIHAMHSGNGGIAADAPPVFVIENARASFTAIENATNDQSYPITVREIRGGVTRDLPQLQSPLNGTAATNNLSFVLPLYVGFSGGGNQAPVLQLSEPRGGRARLTSSRLSLVAQADDDGLPGSLVLSWQQVSGPPGVTFTNPAAASTDAVFPGDGDYLLRLTANDGELGRSIDVHVTVNPDPPTIPTSGLILRYDLDQPTGSTVTDSSGAAHNGTIVNLAQGEWLPGTGVIDGAYRIKTVPEFSWLNGRIEVPFTLPATTRQTVSAWVRQDFESTRSTIYVAHINGIDFFFNHDYNFAGACVYFATPESGSSNFKVYTFASPLPSKGSWFHLAATYDSTTPAVAPKIYINGQLVTSTPSVAGGDYGNPYLSKSNVRKSSVGARSFFPGEGMHDSSLDQFLAYDRALSASEIATIYVSNLGNFAPVADAGPDLSASTGDTLTLQGSVTDDGLPLVPGALSIRWTKLNGPAGPNWSSTTIAAPEVTFLNAGTYTFRVAASDGATTSYDTVTVTVSGENLQFAPEAPDVAVSGTARIGQTLSLSYTYFDANADPENTSVDGTSFRWLRGDSPEGPFLAISGATAANYIITTADYGKFLRAEVTPRSSVEPYTGSPAVSSPFGPALALSGTLPPVTTGLIGFWTFDDRSSPTADLSANLYHATVQSGATFAADGRIASALSPATNAGALASPAASPSGDFTIAAWVRHNNYVTNTNEIILGKGWDTFSLYMATGTNNGQIRIQFKDSTTAQFNANYSDARNWIPAGQWTHLTAIRAGDQFRLYVNGILRTPSFSTGAGSNPPATNNTGLGVGFMPGASHWDGAIDNVGLFNRALTTEEVTQLMNFNPGDTSAAPPPDPGPQLLLRLTFDHGNLADSSPFARVVTGSTGFASLDGRTAATFNGTNQRITVPLQRAFSAGLTVSFWTKAEEGENGMPKNSALGWARQDGGDGLVLAPGWNNSARRLFRIGRLGTENDEVATPTVTTYLNTWVHWTFVKDVAAGTIQVYRDGLPFGSAATGNSIIPVFENTSETGGSSGGLRIGDFWGTLYKGALDDYRIFDRPLDAASVHAIYQASRPNPFTVWANGKFSELPGAASHPDAVPSGDPDEDGIPNLLEYALGGDPLIADAGSRVLAANTVTVEGQNRPTISFIPRETAGLHFFAEASSDLSDWSIQADLTGQLTPGVPYTHEDTANLATSPERFLRLRVQIAN